jgi:hypothetical protein
MQPTPIDQYKILCSVYLLKYDNFAKTDLYSGSLWECQAHATILHEYDWAGYIQSCRLPFSIAVSYNS